MVVLDGKDESASAPSQPNAVVRFFKRIGEVSTGRFGFFFFWSQLSPAWVIKSYNNNMNIHQPERSVASWRFGTLNFRFFFLSTSHSALLHCLQFQPSQNGDCIEDNAALILAVMIKLFYKCKEIIHHICNSGRMRIINNYCDSKNWSLFSCLFFLFYFLFLLKANNGISHYNLYKLAIICITSFTFYKHNKISVMV